MRGLLLAALLLLQDGELDRLLQQLGDADPVVRSRASETLAARGADARATLQKGRDHSDPEIRSRASTLLFRLDQSELLARLEKEQRTAKLNRLAARDWKAPDLSTATDGAVFAFSRRPWAPGGTPIGTIFDTVVHQKLEGEIEWSVAGIRDDQNIAVETCDVHSPTSVYIPALPPLPCTVTVKGTRRWYCDVPVSFKGPVEGTTQRVGKFALMVQWPSIIVSADSAVPQHIVPQILKGWEIRVTLKPSAKRGGGSRETLVARACGLRALPPNPAWCGCPVKPTRGERPPVPTTTAWKVVVSNYALEALEDVESISLLFHNPVEEPFEVASPPLK